MTAMATIPRPVQAVLAGWVHVVGDQPTERWPSAQVAVLAPSSPRCDATPWLGVVRFLAVRRRQCRGRVS